MLTYRGVIRATWKERFNYRQRIIVIAAGLLVLISCLFPPYKEGEVDKEGELMGWHITWAFNKNLRDLIDPPYLVHPDGSRSLEIWEYATAPEILRIEILVILVTAGAALLFAKKR